MFETYLFLFVDSLFASLVLPIRHEMVYPAMIIFGGYDKFQVTLIALTSSVIGLTLNYQIGKLLIFIKKSDFFAKNTKDLNRIEIVWNKYLIWLLPIFVLGSMGPILTLFCGFFRTRFIYFLPLITIGRFLYYFIIP